MAEYHGVIMDAIVHMCHPDCAPRKLREEADAIIDALESAGFTIVRKRVKVRDDGWVVWPNELSKA